MNIILMKCSNPLSVIQINVFLTPNLVDLLKRVKRKDHFFSKMSQELGNWQFCFYHASAIRTLQSGGARTELVENPSLRLIPRVRILDQLWSPQRTTLATREGLHFVHIEL